MSQKVVRYGSGGITAAAGVHLTILGFTAGNPIAGLTGVVITSVGAFIARTKDPVNDAWFSVVVMGIMLVWYTGMAAIVWLM